MLTNRAGRSCAVAAVLPTLCGHTHASEQHQLSNLAATHYTSIQFGQLVKKTYRLLLKSLRNKSLHH